MFKKLTTYFITLFLFGFNISIAQNENDTIPQKASSFIENTISNTYIKIKMCLGDEVILDAGEQDSYYDWSTEEYEKTIAVYDPGKYVVTITKEKDESYLATKTFYVSGVEGPVINRIITDENNPQTIKVFPRDNGNYEYSKNGKDFQKSNIFKGIKNGAYEFFARDTDSCQAVGPVYRYIKL